MIGDDAKKGDPWAESNLGPGTFSRVQLATGRIIDAIVDIVKAAPEMLKKLAEMFGWMIDVVLTPIRMIRELLAKLEHGVLLVALAVLLYFVHGAFSED